MLPTVKLPPTCVFKSKNGTTTILRPLYRSTGVSRHLHLKTGGFCWCRVLQPTCPCWRQPAISDYEDVAVLLNSVIHTVSVPSSNNGKKTLMPNRGWVNKRSLYHTHTHLMALFLGLPSGFYWSERQWVAGASAGPYASLHLAPDR